MAVQIELVNWCLPSLFLASVLHQFIAAGENMLETSMRVQDICLTTDAVIIDIVRLIWT